MRVRVVRVIYWTVGVDISCFGAFKGWYMPVSVYAHFKMAYSRYFQKF